VKDSLDRFGLTPVRYLYKLGVLSPRLIIAHGIYIDDDELRMLADHEVKVVHNPASNMKLASGIHFKFKEMRQLGITVGLGTDGCSSSNNSGYDRGDEAGFPVRKKLGERIPKP